MAVESYVLVATYLPTYPGFTWVLRYNPGIGYPRFGGDILTVRILSQKGSQVCYSKELARITTNSSYNNNAVLFGCGGKGLISRDFTQYPGISL